MGYLDGFGVTIKKWFGVNTDSGRRVTLQYPEETRPKPERFHGRHVLNRYEDGMEKCIGCELCAGVCPAKCIYVRGADNDPDDPTSPGERFGFVYEINYLRCIHCDLCVEACPTEAITETKLFELAFSNRSDAIYTKDELLVGDDGRPRQLPWENWDGGFDPAAQSSGWMRATSPSGDEDFGGIVAWAGELGYGVRVPEGGGTVAPPVAPVAAVAVPAVDDTGPEEVHEATASVAAPPDLPVEADALVVEQPRPFEVDLPAPSEADEAPFDGASDEFDGALTFDAPAAAAADAGDDVELDLSGFGDPSLEPEQTAAPLHFDADTDAGSARADRGTGTVDEPPARLPGQFDAPDVADTKSSGRFRRGRRGSKSTPPPASAPAARVESTGPAHVEPPAPVEPPAVPTDESDLGAETPAPAEQLDSAGDSIDPVESDAALHDEVPDETSDDETSGDAPPEEPPARPTTPNAGFFDAPGATDEPERPKGRKRGRGRRRGDRR